MEMRKWTRNGNCVIRDSRDELFFTDEMAARNDQVRTHHGTRILNVAEKAYRRGFCHALVFLFAEIKNAPANEAVSMARKYMEVACKLASRKTHMEFFGDEVFRATRSGRGTEK